MHKQLQILILPLAAYGAIVGFTAQFLHQQQHLLCGAVPGALISTASACGYRLPVGGALSPDHKHLVFAETERSRLVMLDAQSLAYEGEIGADVLKWPRDVSFGAAGVLYAADAGRNRVAAFEPRPDGSYRYAFQITGDLRAPDGVLARPDGTVYVSSAAMGAVVAFRKGKEIDRDTGLERPGRMTAAPDGSLLVVEEGRNRILKFHADLSLPAEPLALSAPLDEPLALGVAGDGDLVVSERTSSRIKLFDHKGRLLETIGSGTAGFGPTAVNDPAGIAIAGERVWVSDTGNGRIVVINLMHDIM